MDSPLRVLIDDTPSDAISVLDRALHYGHGVFETVLVVRGRPSLWDYHCERMLDGCRRLGIALWRDRVEQSMRDFLGGTESAVLKILVTAGSGRRGYAFDEPAAARLALLLYPAPARSASIEDGITVRVCRTRLSEQPLLAGIKHLNRLEQVLARREWSDPAIEEGLMLDESGRLIEGVQSNLFIVRDGAIATPSLRRTGIAGVMRRFILENRPGCSGCGITEADLRLADLAAADEWFLTNSVRGIMPVVRVVPPTGVDRDEMIRSGSVHLNGAWQRPIGRITRRIAEAVEHEVGLGAQG